MRGESQKQNFHIRKKIKWIEVPLSKIIKKEKKTCQSQDTVIVLQSSHTTGL